MLNQLSQNVSVLKNRISAPEPASNNPPAFNDTTAPLIREPDLRSAELFEGNTDQCGGFLLQCNLAFTRSPSLFSTQDSKIIFVVSAFKKKSPALGTSIFVNTFLCVTNCWTFASDFRSVFDHPLHQEAAAKCLISLRQGSKTAADHSVDFRIAAEEARWEKLALNSIYINSLTDNIKDQLATFRVFIPLHLGFIARIILECWHKCLILENTEMAKFQSSL